MIRLVLLFLISTLFAPLALAAPTPIDAIVAIVDEDIITRREMDARLDLIRADFARNNQRLPEEKTLNRQLIELMINESILAQTAKSRGIRISDGQLNQAMQNLAQSNQKTLSSFFFFFGAAGVSSYDQRLSAATRGLVVNGKSILRCREKHRCILGFDMHFQCVVRQL